MKTGGHERKEPRDLPRLSVNAVCAPEVGTGSNEPGTSFGRCGHVRRANMAGCLDRCGHVKA